MERLTEEHVLKLHREDWVQDERNGRGLVKRSRLPSRRSVQVWDMRLGLRSRLEFASEVEGVQVRRRMAQTLVEVTLRVSLLLMRVILHLSDQQRDKP